MSYLEEEELWEAHLEAQSLEIIQDRPFTRLWKRISWPKVSLFLVSILFFFLAINLLKEGAGTFGPLVVDRFSISNPANSLGLGWLFAYIVMSGSPVAAVALAFFDSGALDPSSTFTMITGSRLGASFIVLFIGFLYVLRGRNRTDSLGMGLLSLNVTGSTYLVALVVGMLLLQAGILDGFQLQKGAIFNSLTDLVLDPITNFLLVFLPGWSLFFIGLGLILISFNLFDRCLPEMTVRESHVGKMSRLIYRPWVMFLLGAMLTLISMSVSLSLSILVPLSQRGFVRRENVIPYIMGANITTFIDTLLASVLLNDPAGFTIVLVEMISITLVSIVLLLIGFRTYERAILALVNEISRNNRNLTLFMFSILLIPLLLLLL